MYNIVESKKGKFNTYIIKNDELKISMEVIPDRGAIVSYLVMDGKSILYMDEDSLFDESKSVHGGIPILFPICGLLKDNKYNVQGKEFFMNRHGFARNYPWQMCDSEISQDNASITLKFVSSQKTLSIYPYEFELYVKYILDAHGLKVQSRIYNISEEDMPFYMGFHPYFNVSSKKNVDFDMSYTSIIDEFNNGFKDGHINILNEETDIVFCHPSKAVVSMKDSGSNVEVQIRYDEHTKYMVLWSQGPHDFVCIEPWMAYADAMNTGKDLTSIKSEDWFEMKFEIIVK